MRIVIRRLEVEGFKSFRDRAILRIPDTVAVLVGGNGSGKSNLTDALRWAFGENDLVSLRARTPAELHFRAHEGDEVTSAARVTVSLEPVAGADGADGGERAGADGAERTERAGADRAGGGERTGGSGRAAGRRGATGGFTFTRTLDRDGRESLSIDGVAAEPDVLNERLRAVGIEMPLRTVIRQGEIGRMLWLRPEERAELFASVCAAPADGGHLGLRALAQEFDRLSARVVHHEKREAELRRELGGLVEAAAGVAEARRRQDQIVVARDRLLRGLARELGLDARVAAGCLDAVQVSHEKTAGARTLMTVSGLAETGVVALAAELRTLLTGGPALGDDGDAVLARRAAVAEELDRVAAAGVTAVADLDRARSELQRATGDRQAAFDDLHERVEARFKVFLRTLVPGADAALPLVGDRRVGVGVRVRYPEKTEVPLKGLSGGQLVTVGLCLALALFLEIPSPVLVLDEVEPALDEIMVRRVTRLLGTLAQERQVIVVSHQRMTRETARTVFQVDRTPALGSHIKLHYDPREFRAPGHR